MVDPTSVWGLDSDDQVNRRSTPSEAEQNEQPSSFDDDQSNISQIETSAFDDDNTDDIPFFRHRGEN